METEIANTVGSVTQLGSLGLGGLFVWIARSIVTAYKSHLERETELKTAAVAAVVDLAAAVREAITLKRAA